MALPSVGGPDQSVEGRGDYVHMRTHALCVPLSLSA